MATQFLRQRIVDAAGGGTDYTIQGAINAAVAAGASDLTSTYWQILIAPGVYTENVTQYGGLHVRGCGWTTQVFGTWDIQAGGHLENLYIRENTSVFAAYALGVRHTGSANNIYVDNIIINNLRDSNAIVSAVEVSGTQAGTSRIRGGFLYARNAIAAPAPLAKAVVIRLLSDFVGVTEFYGGLHMKTSVGSTSAPAEAICLLNQQTAQASGGYAHIVGDWSAPYSGTGTTLDPVLLDNANTLNPGASLDVACWNAAGKIPTIRTAFVGPGDARMHCRYVHSVRAEGVFTESSGGTVFSVPPTLTLNHTPTGADVAPEGTIAYVVP